jgi:hypothetical protein
MASPFKVEFSISEPPAEAQARAAGALTEPARAVDLRLTKRGAGELHYRPRVRFPFLLVLWRTITGERMTVSFKPDDAGGTRVAISGAVARNKHALASDVEHWTEALSG